MEQSDFDKLQKEGGVKIVPQPEPLPPPPSPKSKTLEEQFPALLTALRVIKQPVSTVPTYIPKSFLEQIVIYENGATYRLYVYVNRTWRYTALT